MVSYRREPDFSRLRKVLTLDGEPDCVPFYELFADVEVMAAVLGRPIRTLKDRVDYHLALGYDYINCGPSGLDMPKRGPATSASVLPESGGRRRWFHTAKMNTISTWDDFEKYPWPDPMKADWSDVEQLHLVSPPGMKGVVASGCVLEDTMGLFGYEQLSYLLADNIELVEAVVARVGAMYEQTYRDGCDLEATGAMLISDDLGFNTATMVSPALLRRLVFPWYRKYTDICHAKGVPVILHSCGDLKAVLDDIVDYCHIDAKHSFEDSILPVTEFRRIYGSRIATLGGMDIHFMCTATEGEVRQRTRATLEACMPGGGYALGTGNSVADYVPLTNFLAMLDEGYKAGTY